MSEYSDILYDPRSHTHDNCIKEVPGCDMVVLIVGSRFGGTAIPAAFNSLDFSLLEQESTKSDILASREKLSITQLEVLKAVEQSVPVYAFVDERVMHDHHVYERNKDKPAVIDQIEFPSIQKKETARYVFEFINYLGHRATNNSITGFSRLDDIRHHLTSQWSQLFQRLLTESRTRIQEARRYRDFSERIEDLKAVVLASLATPDLRETAKGAIQFRHLISLVSDLRFVDNRGLLLADISWEKLLSSARIVEIRVPDEEERPFTMRSYLVLDDKTFYNCRYPRRAMDDLRHDWAAFRNLEPHSREAIVDALLGDRESRRLGILRYVDKNIDQYLAERGETSTTDPNEQA